MSVRRRNCLEELAIGCRRHLVDPFDRTVARYREDAAEHLARIEVRDNGNLYAEMFAQTKYLAQWYRYYGGLADKIEGAVIPTDKPDVFNFTRYEPLGVMAMITRGIRRI
jgi:acyl-CoA reductase-like NAD-dependent aldehyde dehydrogenase